MIESKDSIKRFQWMRNAAGGQVVGNRMEIRPLDETAFTKYVVPRLRPGLASSFGEFQTLLPEQTHYAMIWRDAEPGWLFIRIGSLNELESPLRDNEWVIRVEDFDTPDAIVIGYTADSD